MEELNTGGQIRQFNDLVRQALGHALDVLAGRVAGVEPDILLRGRENFINQQWIWLAKDNSIKQGEGTGFTDKLSSIEAIALGLRMQYVKGFKTNIDIR